MSRVALGSYLRNSSIHVLRTALIISLAFSALVYFTFNSITIIKIKIMVMILIIIIIVIMITIVIMVI